MRKLFLIAAVAALTMNVALWSSTITVTSPTTGNAWCLGSTYTITWTKSGAMPDTVAVRLRRAGAPESELAVVNITDSTANNGSLSWTVPASVPAGDYFIRVRTSSPDVIGNSGIFHINSCAPSSATITVTSPYGVDWQIGNLYSITWTKSGSMPATVAIRLRRAGAPETEAAVESITESTPTNDLSYPWTIPNTIPVGDYFIRVRTSSPDVIGNSVNFHIKDGTPTIPGDLWKHRLYYEIRWPRDPNPPCLCPDFDISRLVELIKLHPEFRGSISLLKNGVKLQELGRLGRGNVLTNRLSVKLSRENFDAMKRGSAKFSIAILDANGKILNESLVAGAEQEQLR
jgi:hypothetical protein